MSHLTNLQSRMKAGEVEAVLVSSEINQRYLTGLNYTDGYVLVLPAGGFPLYRGGARHGRLRRD